MPEISDSSVLLPQPLWPMMATNSPAKTRERNVLQRLGLAFQAEIAQADVAQFNLGAALAGRCTDHFALLGELGDDEVPELHALGRLEDVALHQDVLEPLNGGRLDHRRGFPDLEPPVALAPPVMPGALTPGKNGARTLTISDGRRGGGPLHGPVDRVRSSAWITSGWSRMYLSVAMKAV